MFPEPEDNALYAHIHNDQHKILLRLMHEPEMTFNQLWNKEGESNRFAYHLKKLTKAGLVEKTEAGTYQLTVAGKTHVAYVEEESGEHAPLPIVAVAIVAERNDEVLLYHRQKEPFHGQWGVPASKLRAEHYILEQAATTLKEDAGLDAAFELKGLFSSKTYIDGAFAYNHQLFVVRATEITGTLIEEQLNGMYAWTRRDALDDLPLLPNIPHLLTIAAADSFTWIEADRHQEGDAVRLALKDA